MISFLLFNSFPRAGPLLLHLGVCCGDSWRPGHLQLSGSLLVSHSVTHWGPSKPLSLAEENVLPYLHTESQAKSKPVFSKGPR